MATEKQDVIAAAIRLEQDGREFYLEAAAKSDSDLAQGTFEALADDELRHMEYIRQVSAGEDTLQSVNQRTYQRLRGIFAGVPDEVREAVASASGDIEALNLAIEREEQSRVAYERWGKEAETEELRSLCELLTGAELFHRQLLENVIEYLDHPSDFFLREERWIVEG
jgi:rubrerythrin